MRPIHAEGERVSLSVGLGVHPGESVRIRIATGRGSSALVGGSELTYFESSTETAGEYLSTQEGFCCTEDSK